MAQITVTGLTADRMLDIEGTSLVGGHLVGDSLVLDRQDGTILTVGNVRGNPGINPTLRGLSSTSLTVGTGSKVFTISPAMPLGFPVGTIVKATSGSAYMVGDVTASTTTSVTINVTETSGSGTLSSWTLTVGAFKGFDASLTGAAGGALSGTYPNPTLLKSGWQNISLINSWQNFDARTAQYQKIANGWVFCRGIIKTGAIPSNAFVLPAGYRPAVRATYDNYFPCASNNAFGLAAIDAATGNCSIQAGSNVWFDLSGIRFLAES